MSQLLGELYVFLWRHWVIHKCRTGREWIQLLVEWIFPSMQECMEIESVYEEGLRQGSQELKEVNKDVRGIRDRGKVIG